VTFLEVVKTYSDHSCYLQRWRPQLPGSTPMCGKDCT